MSTAENKNFVMEGYRQFKSGDIPQLLERYHDNAEWISPESDLVPFAGKFHGKQGIAQFFAKLDATVQTLRFEPQRMIAEGDKVIVIGEGSWLVKATGQSYDTAWVHVFTMRDGKVAQFEVFSDTAASEKAFRPDLGAQATRSTPLHH